MAWVRARSSAALGAPRCGHWLDWCELLLCSYQADSTLVLLPSCAHITVYHHEHRGKGGEFPGKGLF